MNRFIIILFHNGYASCFPFGFSFGVIFFKVYYRRYLHYMIIYRSAISMVVRTVFQFFNHQLTKNYLLIYIYLLKIDVSLLNLDFYKYSGLLYEFDRIHDEFKYRSCYSYSYLFKSNILHRKNN